MHDDTQNISIPIKAIVEQAMIKNAARYDEDEFNLLRKYFIACLNLNYLEPNDLVSMVNKFASKIKLISLNYNNINKMDYFMINNNVLYINGSLKDTNNIFYEINFYKAVTETLFDAFNSRIGISNVLCNIVAEKVHNMDVNNSRLIMPKTVEEQIGDKKIQIRSGYLNYNLIISLTKQLFISMGINENIIIKKMFFENFDKIIKDIFTTVNQLLLLEVLDKLCIMYINRKVRGIINPNEFELIEKYQIIINDSFKNVDQNYFAFLALITTDELRKKCMKKMNLE